MAAHSPINDNVVPWPLLPGSSESKTIQLIEHTLFRANSNDKISPRKFLKGDILFEDSDGTIQYTGQQLGLDDRRVWRHILEAISPDSQTLQAICFLSSMPADDLTSNCHIRQSTAEAYLTRLQLSKIEWSDKASGVTASCSLIDSVFWLGENVSNGLAPHWVIVINPAIASLFAPRRFGHRGWDFAICRP